ncbi:PAS domain-containing protein [Hymenobacter weizhouensis]|uniref:PAS domain-containing protein n=1 Tax=Hymenobacter sp. YIM 151500-1 TaxID=2987689 RepID=UPI0022268B5C|nr:PAS domain S-box protein [Hymenobacter sp. YIM 151500-1]UYZ63522.1 PAS domain S-box protein [Hymenobacter sp. YIM 151500-1]
MPDSAFPVDYQRLFRSLPENFLLIAPDEAATIVDNTDSHVAVSLKSREEAVGKPFFEAYPATDEASAAVIRESHEHVRRHREAHTMPLIRYDLERPADQGGGLEELYWQATHYPVLSPTGQLEFILQRTQNVTAQVLAEREAARIAQELAEAQQRNTFILETLPVMVWTNRADGTPDFYNRRWEDFTGRSAAEGIEWQSSPGLVHPDDEAHLLQAWQQGVASGQEYQLEFRLRRHDGQYRWVLARNTPRLDAAGQVTMWVGCGTDIHDQKTMVQELLEANEQQAALSDQAYEASQEARRQREILYNLFMQAPAVISIGRGPEHRHEFVNPLYEQVFAGRELLGRTAAEVIPEAESQGFIALLDHVYQTGEPFVGREVGFTIVDPVTGQGTERFFNVTYLPVRENGQIVGISHFSYDVTELVEARRALAALGHSSAPGAAPTLP